MPITAVARVKIELLSIRREMIRHEAFTRTKPQNGPSAEDCRIVHGQETLPGLTPKRLFEHPLLPIRTVG